MDSIQDILARNLRLARQRVGVSQEELADRAGVDRTYVSGIERGVRNPTIAIVARLASELGTTAAALLEDPRTAER
ncbi:MAG TPA: helix-turn-helix transcriptional regulator [Devosia sp.]|jgi:transcriptional regulator with XRE-family HTH domain|uniref:helix-turn-helix domain-containing protein n=1 Tax=Devosia sp. TaxID=1871048 RepID=UPI002DDD665F|nr:helix-turn-helix transcriptional regulator [Devosia sp.]HEV2515403.1 helix-turn-helix transcriptional regulator [Devosia sp.]